MILLPGAAQTQRYDGSFKGVYTRPTKGVLHSTEGGGWPAYDGGAVAPNLTALWDGTTLQVRQHYPLDMSGRALKNLPGGVETNGAGTVQIELVGTCDPAFHAKYPSVTYWPEVGEKAMAALALLLRSIEALTDIPARSTTRPWLAYPSSYGNSPARMSFAEWNAFKGWCGHQHVPENVHGDPGNLNISHLFGPSASIHQSEEDTTMIDPNVVDLLQRTKNAVDLLVNVAARPLEVEARLNARLDAMATEMVAMKAALDAK